MSTPRRAIVFISVTFAMNSIFASEVGTVQGTITDRDTGEPLPGVNVIVEGTTMGAATDAEGDYYIINVPVGTYAIMASMIGYKSVTVTNVRVIRDQSVWVNFRLEITAIVGEEVTVIAERPLVEKDVTGKKVVVDAEEIVALPVRNIAELYTLQSGVIEVKSAALGIPGFEDRGIEEIHVRGGRSGETGFMVDGMYLENPIYGGIGRGSRLNQYAVEEVDFQTGFYNAEYGDNMSGLINNVTRSGGKTYSGAFRYEDSRYGAKQDRLRNYRKLAGGFGGPAPVLGKRLKFWVSGDLTMSAYRVLKFDDLVYDPDNPGPNNEFNREKKVSFWDRYAGWRSFGFDNTWDINARFDLGISRNIKLAYSYWQVDSKAKVFDPWYLYNNKGRDVLMMRSFRHFLEWRHQVSEKTFYTIRFARFTQQRELKVRNYDSDGDGWPDWFEFRYQSDPYRFSPQDPTTYPHTLDENGDAVPILIDDDTNWHLGHFRYWATITQGDSTWVDTLDVYTNNSVIPDSIYSLDPLWHTSNPDTVLDSMWIDASDFNYWLEPEQYNGWIWNDPIWVDSTWNFLLENPTQANSDSLFYLSYLYEFGYGGDDRYWHESESVTDEIRIDIQSQVTKHNQVRMGIDWKRHRLMFDDWQLPWYQGGYTDRYGTGWRYGPYDPPYKPVELGVYIQDKLEVPNRLVVNAGIRSDFVNYEGKSWADPRVATPDSALLKATDWQWNVSPRLGFSHIITDQATFTFGYGVYHQNPTYRNVFVNSDALGDSASFFTPLRVLVGNAQLTSQKVTSYEFGVKYQFLPQWALTVIGWTKDYSNLNSTELVRLGPVRYSVFVNYDYGSSRGFDFILQKRRRRGNLAGTLQYTFSVAKANRADPWEGYRNSDNPLSMPKHEILMPYDRTHDLSLQGVYELRAKQGPYVFGIYPCERTKISLTSNFLSGAPYTPILSNDRAGPQNSERMPSYFVTNVALRKYISVGPVKMTLGILVRNLFNRKNPIDIYVRTGSPDDPGVRARENIENGYVSSTLYDRPWYYDDLRSIDVFTEMEFE